MKSGWQTCMDHERKS